MSEATMGVLFKKAEKVATGNKNLKYLNTLVVLPLPNIIVTIFSKAPELCKAALTMKRNPTVNIPLFENPEKASSIVIIFPRIKTKRLANTIKAGLKNSFAKANDMRTITIAV